MDMHEILRAATSLLTVYGLKLVGAVLILIAGWSIASWANRAMLRLARKASRLDPTLTTFLASFVRWAILAFDPPFPFVVFAQILHGATFALAHLGAMYFILKAVPPRLSATAQSLYAVGANGIAMGLATYSAGRLYPAFGGRTYLLMAAMGLGAMGFAWLLGRTWHGGRITAQT